MNKDEAREYFKKLGLSYNKITPLKIRMLSNILETELIAYIASGDFHAAQMGMQVSPLKNKDVKFKNGQLEYAFIKIDGSYFKCREGISFNSSGFIGFGGEFSTVNTAPILRAFCKWCDALTNREG